MTRFHRNLNPPPKVLMLRVLREYQANEKLLGGL